MQSAVPNKDNKRLGGVVHRVCITRVAFKESETSTTYTNAPPQLEPAPAVQPKQ
jgi:hypothetical protein